MRRALAVIGLIALAQIGLGLLRGALGLVEAGFRAALVAVFLIVLARLVVPVADALVGRGRDGQRLFGGPQPTAGTGEPATKDKTKDKTKGKKKR